MLVTLLTELLTDNDKATQMVSEKQMIQIVDFLHPECWKIENKTEIAKNPIYSNLPFQVQSWINEQNAEADKIITSNRISSKSKEVTIFPTQ